MIKFRGIKSILMLGSLAVLISVWAGCTPAPKTIYRLSSGESLSESGLSELNTAAAVWVIVDDRYFVDCRTYGSVKLPAGLHRIKWATVFGVSVMVDAAGYASFEAVTDVDFEAGCVYELKADRTTGLGYRAYMWVEEKATGKTVGGTRKP